MQSNYKITTITSNPTRELVYFYSGTKLLRAVSMVKEFSLSENGEKIAIYSLGLPAFEFDIFAIEDIDGTIYPPLSSTQGAASQAYQAQLSLIMDQLGTIFKGCCDDGGGGGSSIQFQDEGVNVGTAGQYTTYNFTGNVNVTETAPSVVDVEILGGGVGQADIQFQDEGSNLGTAGTVDTLNIVGDLHKTARVGNTVTHTAPSVGENLQMTSLDPANPLNAKIGALIANVVVWNTSGSRQHNLAVTGWNDAWDGSLGTGKATLISYEGADWSILTGVSGGANGRSLVIFNNTNELVILEHESTGSTSGNRFCFSNGIPCFLMPYTSIEFVYYGSKWRAKGVTSPDLFDDYVTSNNVGGVFNGVMFNQFFTGGNATWGTSAASQQDTQFGAISASPAIGARNFISTAYNANYAGSGISVPVLSVQKIAFSGSPSGNKRIALGLGNYVAAAGSYYTSSALQAGWGFASDTGLANAATNWFLYAGIGGAASILATGIDSGIPVSQAVNEYNVFVTFYNPTTGVMKAFYSQDRMAYSFVNTRTGIASSSGFVVWYEAYGTALPTMYLDYTGFSTKIDTNR